MLFIDEVVLVNEVLLLNEVLLVEAVLFKVLAVVSTEPVVVLVVVLLR